jgi:hypothetical protein
MYFSPNPLYGVSSITSHCYTARSCLHHHVRVGLTRNHAPIEQLSYCPDYRRSALVVLIYLSDSPEIFDQKSCLAAVHGEGGVLREICGRV